ncbi:hypothetical protein Bbelb_216990 [Branchiostoma belcheri]|nr:hypothetical protein Bbelb_216990 [Branchiostoma belcheri]
MLYDNGLEQLVKYPTRDDNTLDLFLTNCPNQVPRVEVVPGLSDHCIPYCELTMGTMKKKQAQRLIPLYAKADWDNLRAEAREISAELQEKGDSCSTEDLSGTLCQYSQGMCGNLCQKSTYIQLNYGMHFKKASTTLGHLKVLAIYM